MTTNLISTIGSALERLVWRAWMALRTVDERGGGRNTDEGFHISGGAILAGTVLTIAGAFVAKKLGALE